MGKRSKRRMSLKEKVALSVFMECVPLLIDRWKKTFPDGEKTFDVYLIEVYREEKERQEALKNKKKEE